MALSETKIDLQNVQSFVVTGKDIRRWDIDKTRCLSCRTSKNCCCGSVLLNKVSSLWRHITLSVFPVWYRKFTSLMYRDGKLSVWCTSYCKYLLTLFPASSDFCRLLMTSANSLDPDQARQNVRPDLDPNCLTL